MGQVASQGGTLMPDQNKGKMKLRVGQKIIYPLKSKRVFNIGNNINYPYRLQWDIGSWLIFSHDLTIHKCLVPDFQAQHTPQWSPKINFLLQQARHGFGFKNAALLCALTAHGIQHKRTA